MRAESSPLSPSRCSYPLCAPRPTADPWNLVIFGLIGGYLGSKIPGIEQQLLTEVNEMRAERNIPPLKREGGVFALVKVDETKKM